jgi:hypothetical protein
MADQLLSAKLEVKKFLTDQDWGTEDMSGKEWFIKQNGNDFCYGK